MEKNGMESGTLRAGLDVGSITAKLIVLDEDDKTLLSSNQLHQPDQKSVGERRLRRRACCCGGIR